MTLRSDYLVELEASGWNKFIESGKTRPKPSHGDGHRNMWTTSEVSLPTSGVQINQHRKGVESVDSHLREMALNQPFSVLRVMMAEALEARGCVPAAQPSTATPTAASPGLNVVGTISGSVSEAAPALPPTPVAASPMAKKSGRLVNKRVEKTSCQNRPPAAEARPSQQALLDAQQVDQYRSRALARGDSQPLALQDGRSLSSGGSSSSSSKAWRTDRSQPAPETPAVQSADSRSDCSTVDTVDVQAPYAAHALQVSKVLPVATTRIVVPAPLEIMDMASTGHEVGLLSICGPQPEPSAQTRGPRGTANAVHFPGEAPQSTRMPGHQQRSRNQGTGGRKQCKPRAEMERRPRIDEDVSGQQAANGMDPWSEQQVRGDASQTMAIADGQSVTSSVFQ